MMSSQTFLIAILVAIVSISPLYASFNAKTCTYISEEFNTVYNFQNLELRSNGQLNYYSVDDNSADDAQDLYNYYFNLCTPVLQYPHPRCQNSTGDSDGENYSYCTDITNDGKCAINTDTNSEKLTEITGKAYAYQLKVKQAKAIQKGNDTIYELEDVPEDERVCYPLSNNKESNMEISLYDDLDPTQGIRIHYSKGAWGGAIGDIAGGCTTNRELDVILQCDNDPDAVPRKTEVEEIAPCKYEIKVGTIYGCPSGCGLYASSLCSNQGLCGYDFGSNVSRCFCYWGWKGSACERKNGHAFWTPTEEISANLDKNKPDSSDSYARSFKRYIQTTDPFNGKLVDVWVNVTYDLTDAHNSEAVYHIDDTADKNEDHHFYFNIAGQLDAEKLPKECHTKVLKPCLEPQTHDECRDLVADGNFFTEPNHSGYAFRWTNNSKLSTVNETVENECILLGTQFNHTWKLYDNNDNPAHGVILTYYDGSYLEGASNDEVVVNHKFELTLICPDSREEFYTPTATDIVMDASEVEYASNGLYKASYETVFACPFNCQTKSGKAYSVCGGRGLCVADPNLKHTRCICDEKYYEDDCSKEYVPASAPTAAPAVEQSSDTGFNVAIAIISILLIGFVVAVVYLYMRNKTLEKYAVPILDEAEQVEPRVPDYDDSDSEHFHNRPKISGGKQEMVTVSTNLSGNNDSGKKKFGGFGLGNLGNKRKTKGRGKNKYQAQYSDGSDDDDDDDEDGTNGPSGYLVANEDDDESESDSE